MTTNEARRIYLVPYEPAWPDLAAQVAGEILEGCGPDGVGAITRVEHIGSTAIAGCDAKPVIDLMPALVSFEAGRDCVAPLKARGYQYRGQFGLPRRHYFSRPAAASTIGIDEHVHMYTPGEGQWDDQLAFRDYLRAHEDARDEYVALKRELALRHPHDGDAYAEDKSNFVQRILRLAQDEVAS